MIAYIHIGTEKTGTTAIQEFLYLNRERLSEDGVYFSDEFGGKNNIDLVVFSKNDGSIDYLAKDNSYTNIKVTENWKIDYRKKFRKKIRELSTKYSMFVFSSEHLSSCLAIDDEVCNTKDLLGGLFDEIKIIVYLRRQDLLVISRYNEILKSGKCSKSVLSPLSESNFHIYYYHLLVSMWGRVFGEENIIVRDYNLNKLSNNDIVDDFMLQLGMPSVSSKYVRLAKKPNQSLSGDSQRVLIFFNCLFKSLGIEAQSRYPALFRKMLIMFFNQFSFTKRKTLSKKQAVEFFQLFSDTNRKLPTGEGTSNKFFSSDFEMYD